MEQPLTRPERFFFGTRSLPCPYVDGRIERKVVTDLSGPNVRELYERLTRAGFRRSHGLTYRPACPRCSACVPVRILVRDFEWSDSFRRVMRRNRDLLAEDKGAEATVEQYRLFARYQQHRHAGGDMSAMTFADYRAMVEETPVETRMVEFRDRAGTLVAGMLADRMSDSFSAVYSYFDGGQKQRGLGTFMVLWLIENASALGLDYVYLGFWISDSDKMAYKARFHPLERLGPDGWVPLEA